MDPLLTRILLSIVLWPVALVLYICLCFTMGRRIDESYIFIWTGIGVGFVVCCWLIMVWKTHIRWTSKRIYQTVLTIPAAISVGIAVGVVSNWASYWGREPFSLIGSIVALASWPLMAVLVWRETPEERQRRTTVVSCPECGYDLHGLSECRCPECGQQYTIDQLYAAQPRPPLEVMHRADQLTGVPSRVTSVSQAASRPTENE